MRLFIAEKPSLARALVDVLPKPHKKHDGFIETSNGDVVTWCIGHLLEQAEPDAYDPVYKKWNLYHLPIIPQKWQLVVKANTKKQFNIVKGLIKKADIIVNMGDPDRVGQILVDEVIHYSGISKEKLAEVQRCLISDLNPSAVKKALNNLRKNTDFIPLATSALARARADWLYGINMTRFCTLQGQRAGYSGVLSVGRVQTPILGLVVARDQEIENFVSKPFYEVIANIETIKNEVYQGKWIPSEACEPYMDEDNRVLSKALVENIIKRIKDKPGKVLSVKENKRKQEPPLPYNLSALQIDASRRYGMSAKQVLDTCQKLYEIHKLITYPRSDSRYLPKEHFNDVLKVSSAIKNNSHNLASVVDKANFNLKSKAWDDKKVTAHHAIIPTSKSLKSNTLTVNEANIYELVAKQYLMQFYPAFEYMEKQIDTQIEGGMFISKQKEIVLEGWKELLYSKANKNYEDFSTKRLPEVIKDEDVKCIGGELVEKQTTSPRHFTDATLMSAMTGIARYVSDKEIKKVLRATDGLGTEATRAGIIELLFKRQFLVRKGKEIRATDIGKQLIANLPTVMVTPDMTAHWESQLEAISKQEMKYSEFMNSLILRLNQLLTDVQSMRFQGLQHYK